MEAGKLAQGEERECAFFSFRLKRKKGRGYKGKYKNGEGWKCKAMTLTLERVGKQTERRELELYI